MINQYFIYYLGIMKMRIREFVWLYFLFIEFEMTGLIGLIFIFNNFDFIFVLILGEL